MYQIKRLKDLYQISVSTTKSDEILDRLKSILHDENQEFILSFNNIFLSRKVNYNLLEIGYSPQEIISVTKAAKIKTFFCIVYFDSTISIINDQFATVFEAKKFFADQFYTVPRNIIIKYKNKELRDSEKIIQYHTDESTTFQVSVNERYFLVRTYLNEHHFACLKLNSTVENLKETISMYSQNDNSIEFQCVYSDNLKEICKHNNIEDESDINTKNLQELAFLVPVFEFTKSTKYSNKKFTITIEIKDEKFNKEITKNYNSTERISLYSLTVLLERDLGIDRSLFIPFNQDGTKMKLTEFASPNKKNFIFKIFNSLNVKIDKTVQKISYLTTIKEIQEKYKFEKHNFGIIINNHYAYEKKEDNKYLIIHFMNKTKEPTDINIQYSLEPSQLITYTKIEPTKKTKTQFIIPESIMKNHDQIAITYLNQNKNSINIIKKDQNEIQFQDSKKQIINCALNKRKSVIYKSIEIIGDNIRLIDLFDLIFKNDNIFDDTNTKSLKKHGVFIAKIKDEKLNFWEKISNIYYDKKNRITIESLEVRNKTHIMDLYNNNQAFDKISLTDRHTSAKIINNYCKEKGFSAENLYLYADFNKLRKNDIPSLFKQEHNFLILNQERDKKKLIIKNLAKLKIEFIISKDDYSNCADIIRNMFQLSEKKIQLSCIINSIKYILPEKFDAGAFPDDCEIEIQYEYQKKDQMKFKYQNDEEKILKVDVDQPIESIIPVVQKEFKLWHLSKSVIYFSFYSFDFPLSKSISFYQVPETATIEIRERKEAFPIQISTPNNSNFNNYYFGEDDTIADVIDHLKNQFTIEFAIYGDSKATKMIKIDTKLEKDMKLYVVGKQKTIKCEGSIGDDEIEVSEILTVKEASNYISMKLKSKVFIFTKNKENKSYESAIKDKRLSEYKEQLYAHKYFQTIDFNYVIFSKNEHISELNTINWLREKYISKVLLINMNDFIIKKNETRLKETDTIGQVLENFTGKLNIYVKDNIQKTKHLKSHISARKYKPITTNDIFSKSTASPQKKCIDKSPRMKENDDDFQNANKSYSSSNNKKFEVNKEKSDRNKEVKNNIDDDEESYKIKNKKDIKETGDGSEEKKSKFGEEKAKKCKPKNIADISFKSKRSLRKKYKPLTSNINESDNDYEENKEQEKSDKENFDGDKDEEKNEGPEEKCGSDELDYILIDPNNYQKHNKIGHGMSCNVYKIEDKKTGEIYAAKIFSNSISDTSNIEKRNLYRELNIMAKITHPNIVKFIGFSPINFHGENKPIILTELVPNGSLKDLLENERNGISLRYWDDTHKLITIYSIALAMSFLHSHGIIHRDLKPANILMIKINGKFYPKVADFGLSKFIISLEPNSLSINDSSGIIGTPTHMAPEIINYSPEISNDSPYTKASDVYAFGIVVYEIITGKTPFEGLNIYQICSKVSNRDRPQFPEDTPDVFKELIESCWNQNAKERPSFEKIIKVLKENKEFITENVDENKYLSYIDYFENHQTKYDSTKKISSQYIQKK